MRELKFRAWSYKDKKMVYGIEKCKVGCHFSDWLNNPRFEVMQYTGMKDYLGKEIYEGDILHYFCDWILDNTKGKIIFKEGGFMVSNSFDEMLTDLYKALDDTEGSEIIGNEFENPELLEGVEG